MGNKILFGLALLLIAAGMVNFDTPWFSNNGSASWPLRIGLVALGVVLCLIVVIRRRTATSIALTKRQK